MVLVLYQIIPHESDVHEFWLANARSGSLSMTVAEFSRALYRTYNVDIEEQYSIKSDKGLFDCLD